MAFRKHQLPEVPLRIVDPSNLESTVGKWDDSEEMKREQLLEQMGESILVASAEQIVSIIATEAQWCDFYGNRICGIDQAVLAKNSNRVQQSVSWNVRALEHKFFDAPSVEVFLQVRSKWLKQGGLLLPYAEFVASPVFRNAMWPHVHRI